MAHWRSLQLSLSGDDVPTINGPDRRHQPSALPNSGQEDGDHFRVAIYNSFQNEVTQFHPSQSQHYFQRPGWYATGSQPVGGSNRPEPATGINPSQTVIYSPSPNSGLPVNPNGQYPFYAGPTHQPLLPLFQPGSHSSSLPPQWPEQEQQDGSEYPPVYLTANNVPATQVPTGGLLLVPPGYNYAANHPSSADSKSRAFSVL